MKPISILSIILLSSIGLAGCHTSEDNYKRAYEKAVKQTKENQGERSYDAEMAKKIAYTDVVNGDSVRLVRSYCKVTDGNAADAKRYNVIVGEFDQVINARSYRDRLHQHEGFSSYVLYCDQDRKYCVVVQGFDDKASAAYFLKYIHANVRMKVLTRRPWILEKL